ncbi:conserved exported hypothetical protein [Vibrio crassostreae]|uniref:DUF2057 family protein n=1 Tax=Vibrio crassostreae TaxID=246167 RepID=UPI001042C22D|nr:DUF2057 family protein [Vibrio crassostreae]TCN89180.1 hypothetical protein EDB37_1006131 [Vibrio crassostreae]CAK2486166.1 conserved exported hypothetical protein [Vibrio crassostreae]CAK2527563.1 conserved exported hypothetical protein [Vibrio crassostreae]CAK3871711.1 conserved exported hypothetical protein [Vibrio crassostreae]CAK3965868.1 conserved exported hypothetical protein [Vibrio crassostreae]
MKTLKSIALLSTIIAAPHAFADVTIEVPSSADALVEVLAVNEAKPALEGGFFSSSKTITVPDGVNQIVFKYQLAFSQGNDREFVDSDTIIATFDATDTALTFDMPKFRNTNEAKKGLQNLDWKLVDENQNAISVKQDKLIKDGMQIGRKYPQEAKEYNQKGGIAALTVGASAGAAAAAVVQPVTLPAKIDGNAANTAEEMLYFWYGKADAETKQKFKDYVNK